MQKRILTFVLTLACLTLASAALAETFTGGSVTVEVPAGWTTIPAPARWWCRWC